MAIKDEIQRLIKAKEDFKTKLIEKGVTVSDEELISDYPPKLDLIKGGATVTEYGDLEGTVVPNSGYVEKVYFNTELSIDEVTNIIKGAYGSGKGAILSANPTGEFTDETYLMAGSDSGIAFISGIIGKTLTYLFIGADAGAGFVGWNPTFNGEVEVNAEVYYFLTKTEEEVGINNAFLTNLFSLTPFVPAVKGVTKLEGDYDGSTLVINEPPKYFLDSTPVPMEGPIEQIYVNYNLDPARVTEILASLEYDIPDEKYPQLGRYIVTSNDLQIAYDNQNQYFNISITRNSEQGVYGIFGSMYGVLVPVFTSSAGWIKDVVDKNPSPIIRSYIAVTDGKYGAQNDKLAELFSTTPIVIKEQGVIDVKSMIKDEKKLPLSIKLDLKQDGFPIEVNSLPKSDWIGTAVPNSGMVENIYFNTNLSVNDVVDVLSKLTYNNNTYFVAHSGSKIIEISNEETLYVIKVDDIIVFCNMAEPSIGLNRGWSDTLQNPYQFNSEANSVAGIYEVGTQNDLLSSLFSTTPFIEDNPAEEESIYKIKGGYDIYLQMETLKEMASAYGISLPCTFGQYMDALITAMGGGEGSFDYEVIVVTQENYNEFILNPKMSVIDNEALSMFFTIYALMDENARTQYDGFTFISFTQEDNEIQWLPVVHEFVAGMMGLEYENDTVMFKGIMSDPKEITEDGYYIIGSEQSQYYLCEDNAFKELIPEDKFPKIIVKGEWQGTAVPNTGMVEKVYLNGSVENQKETLWSIITSLPYQTALGRKCYPVFIREDLQQCLLIQDVDSLGVLYELRLLEGTNETTYLAITTDEIQSLGDVIINVNANVVESYPAYGITNVGSDNDKLSTLISITPIVQDIVEQVKPEGEYDGSTLVLNELPKGVWNGTAVPSEGFIEKVYLNTSLSVDKVKEMLSQLTYSEDSSGNLRNILLYSSSTKAETGVIALKINETFVLAYSFSRTSDDGTTKSGSKYIYMSSDIGLGIVGWVSASEFDGIIDVNDEVALEYEGVSIGTQNNLLSSLFSTTPFTQSKPNTIDVKALIEQKKIPLEIEVNVEEGTNTTDATATPNEIRKGFTAYIASGKVEGVIEDYDGSFEGGIEISGGGVSIPSVTDLTCDSEGNVSWTAPNFDSLASYNPTISYVVSVNGSEVETTTTNVNIANYLIEGTNIINVKVKAIINHYGNVENISVEYSKPQYQLLLLNSTLPNGTRTPCGASVDNYGYIFGGSDSNGNTNKIYKFNVENENAEELSTKLPIALNSSTASAVGTNIYIFGGFTSGSTGMKNTIYKFNTVTNTISTLSQTLPQSLYQASSVAVGTNIYIFGGITTGYSNVKTILKFDTTTEKITTLTTQYKEGLYRICAEAFGDYIYCLGGYSGGSFGGVSIYKFDTKAETITTLNVVLPIQFYNMHTIHGNNIYLFFGSYPYNDSILKFDIYNEVIEELEIKNPYIYDGLALAISGATYIFGGYNRINKVIANTIYKFTA